MYASLADSPARQGACGSGSGRAPHPTPATTATAVLAGPVASPDRTASPSGPVEGTWPLEHTPEAAGQARRVTRACSQAWELDEDGREAVLLVVSELVTNAVEHAQAPVHLHLHHSDTDGRVWIGVSDGGPAERDGAWTRDEHGRGLAVVEALAEIHGTRTHLGGHTTHWARINPTAA